MFKKIIVLGMDNTGKTTLCKELSKRLEYEHVTSLGPKASKEEMEEFIDSHLTDDKPMVFERFCFFEEMVYGNILRGQSKFHWDGPYHYRIQEAKPLIIYCRPSRRRILKFGDREQMEGVIKNGEKLLATFDDLYFKLPAMGFFTTTYDFESYYTINHLVEWLEMWKGVKA